MRRGSLSEPVEIFGTVKHRTDAACLLDDGTQEVWVPISQIIGEESDGKGNVTLTIPEWLAINKGLV